MGPSYRFAQKIGGLALVIPVLVALILFTAIAPSAPRANALDNEESAWLTLLNDYRAQNGVGPLAANDSLNYVARWMANDLAANNYFSHTDSLGRDPFLRMDQLGYAYNTWRGENLVAGTETSSHAMQMWQGSPPHNENMLNPNYTVVGIARSYDSTSDFGWYWATEFGGEGGPPPPPPAPEPTSPPAPYVPPPPAPEPAPVAPAPAQAAPPPAPTNTPEPTPSPSPVPTATPSPAPDTDGAWWHSVIALERSWTAESEIKPGSESFARVR